MSNVIRLCPACGHADANYRPINTCPVCGEQMMVENDEDGDEDEEPEDD